MTQRVFNDARQTRQAFISRLLNVVWKGALKGVSRFMHVNFSFEKADYPYIFSLFPAYCKKAAFLPMIFIRTITSTVTCFVILIRRPGIRWSVKTILYMSTDYFPTLRFKKLTSKIWKTVWWRIQSLMQAKIAHTEKFLGAITSSTFQSYRSGNFIVLVTQPFPSWLMHIRNRLVFDLLRF